LLDVWNGLSASQAGLTTAPDGSVLVADYGNYSVDRISGGELSTVKKFALGSVPDLDGSFRPTGIAVSRDGRIYASDIGGSAGTSGALIQIDPTGAVTVLTT
jgi:hypothetical protein